MLARLTRFFTAVFVSALVLASPATAQEDGVFVDPDSPAEKEYALPIDKARSQADPKRRSGQQVRKGAGSAPTFGEGVGETPTPESAGGSAGVPDSNSSSDSTATQAATRTDPSKARKAAQERARARKAKRSARESASRRTASADRKSASDASSLPDSAEVARLATSTNEASAGGISTPVVVGGVGGTALLAAAGVGVMLRRRRT